MNEFNETTNFSIHPDIAYTLIDDEAVIMRAVDDAVFGMNHVGTELFKCLESNAMSAHALADHLYKQFEVDQAQSLRDAKEFLQSMLFNNLIVPVS
jgi:hypothetical protein